MILKILFLATSKQFCVFKGVFRVSWTIILKGASKMAFEDGILGIVQNIQGNPYLNSTTVLCDIALGE